jgi:anti-sigma factor RsiW
LFSSYIEDEISQEERRHLEAHVMGCRRCSLGLREVRATMSILSQELPLVAPSAHFDEDVYARIRSGEGLRPTARELIRELLAPFRPWVAASVGVSAAVVAFALSPFGQTMLHTAASNGHVTQQAAGIATAPVPAPSGDVTPPAASTGPERILAERTGSSGPAASSVRRSAPVMASTTLRSSTEPDSIVDGRIPRQRYTDEIINDQFYLERGLEGQQNPSVVPVNETQDDGVYIVF